VLGDTNSQGAGAGLAASCCGVRGLGLRGRRNGSSDCRLVLPPGVANMAPGFANAVLACR